MSELNPLLSSIIRIRSNVVRSVNIENDLRSTSVAQGYVLTAQALTYLSRILNGLGTTTTSRAWTLTGPYGSGKSYFSLFLMNLVCAKQPGNHLVEQQLRIVDPLLAEQASQVARLVDSQGLLPVPVTGYRTSLHECLRQGFIHSLQFLEANEDLKSIINTLKAQSGNENSRSFIYSLEHILDVITQPSLGYHGILLTFDELGKPLEHAVTHPEVSDIYLLQEIAEFANRSNEKPVVFVGILHQAFERYAAYLDSTTQREWAKVQGRFEDIAFQEPPNQQMRLIANALESLSLDLTRKIGPLLKQTAHEAMESGWCPPMMGTDEFEELCQNTYPLHPSVLVALPYVFRRLAQNERSIFAFLASHEPLGYQVFLENHHLPEFLRLSDVFDYLAANFQARLYASGRAHILAEALDRLNSTPNIEPLEADVIKTIGLLNWLGEVSHLQVTEQALLAALRSPEHNDAQLRKVLRSLQSRSLVVYRRFSQTYTIWQGSDVDIEERLEEASRKLSSTFSLAEAVERYLPTRPLVARRHSYQTGTLRYFEVRYVDVNTRDQVPLALANGANGLILVCLPTNFSDADIFCQWAQQTPLSERSDIVIGIASRTARLAELLQELRYLHWVEDHTPELAGDQVARRELRARLATIETLIQTELDQTISLHRLADSTGGQWFHSGKKVSLPARQGLTHLLSYICDELYPHAPRLWNELINRRVLSSQGAAARRTLIEGILTRA